MSRLHHCSIKTQIQKRQQRGNKENLLLYKSSIFFFHKSCLKRILKHITFQDNNFILTKQPLGDITRTTTLLSL